MKVNDERVTLPTSTSRVADVLASAGVTARPGMTRSILTGRLLEPNGNPPNVEIDGKAVSLEAILERGATLKTGNGADTLESVDKRNLTGPLPGGAPDEERTLWQPGRPRLERAWVGRVSGEVVSTLVTEPETAPQPATGKVVALTLDDGPWPVTTPAALQILKEEGVKATFCIVGQHGRAHPELVQAIVDGGHTLCNHTVDHRLLAGRSREYIYAQIAGGSEFLSSFTGVAPEIFRAPGGVVTPDVVEIAHAQRMRVLGWSVDSRDYQKVPADAIAKRVLTAAHPGAVILMHDGGGDRSASIGALRPIITGLKAQGYSFATPTQPAAP